MRVLKELYIFTVSGCLHITSRDVRDGQSGKKRKGGLINWQNKVYRFLVIPFF